MDSVGSFDWIDSVDSIVSTVSSHGNHMYTCYILIYGYITRKYIHMNIYIYILEL